MSKGNGSLSSNDYVFIDKERLTYGNAFYRLKMVDFDGKVNYSAPVFIRSDWEIVIRLHPNPVLDTMIIQHPSLNGNEQVMILDKSGKIVAIGKLTGQSNISNIDTNLLMPGDYFLVFSNGTNTQSVKFIKI